MPDRNRNLHQFLLKHGMNGRRRMRRAGRAKAVAAVLAAAVAFGCVSTSAILAADNLTVIRVGNLMIEAEGIVSPKALPKKTFEPIDLQVRGAVSTTDGSHVPAVLTAHLQVDRHIKIETAGLPICTLAKIRATSPAVALKNCGNALLGRGYATAEVAFPEQVPFSAKGQLLAFNGPIVGGYSEQLDYLYLDVPAPTAVIVTAKFSKGSGGYGYSVAITLPRIAGGAGSLTSFEFTLGRKWTYKGRRRSYLSAECPDGHFSDRIEAEFAEGTELDGTVINRCRSKS